MCDQPCPTCGQYSNTAKDMHIAALTAERDEMRQRYDDAEAENARLRALVAVGREMVFALEHGLATIRADKRESLCRIHISLAEASIAKWCSLEGVK